MRITLERADLLRILSKSLGYEIDDDDLTVNPDPFEVSIKRVPVDEIARGAAPPDDSEDVQENVAEELLDDLPEEESSPEVAAVMTMEQVLNASQMLRQDNSRTVGTPPLTRPLGPEETEEPPPISEKELRALTRSR